MNQKQGLLSVMAFTRTEEGANKFISSKVNFGQITLQTFTAQVEMVKVVKTQQDVIISVNYGTGTRTRLTADGYRAIYWSCTKLLYTSDLL